jgi:crotonobetainyl-CoA:carnitine CoA-transferase CaiB-like acyl-CoA transferase
MSKPLAGIKVIEIGQELAGPFAGLFLADMGAEVVKVENKTTGDTSRWLLPITIAGPDVRNAMVPPMFVGANRGKRSIAADLKNPKAIELLSRMAKSYDVLMTNYRPGVLDRLGLGWDEMRNINPRLVYAQASSWGPVGPWATRASRDPLAQAAGGLMAKTGMPSDPPLIAGTLVADNSGALCFAGGILAALVARERTGEGQRVDTSIYGTMIAIQATEINYTSFTGVEPERTGRGANPLLHGAWGAFRTRDGHICLAGVDMKRWHAFCCILGIEDRENDPDFEVAKRHAHGEKLMALLDEIFPRRTSKEWLRDLDEADILATEVVDYRSMLVSEQARANGYLLELDHPTAGRVLVAGTPVTINGEIPQQARPVPELGQHTEEVMIELGYSWEEIAAMREAGAIL